MGKPKDLPESSRKVREPYSFSFCPFCGNSLRKGTFPVGKYKVNTYVVCGSCDIQLI